MPQNSEWFKLHGTLPDGGQVYAETNLHNFIAEPWNAASSLAFLIPAIYWTVKLRNRFRQYKFLTFCIPLLMLGGLGSTLFHAFRASEYLLMLDYLPIFVLTAAVSIYLWKSIIKKWAYLLLLAFLILIIRLLVSGIFSPHEAMNIGYFFTGTLIFLPAMILLVKTNLKGLRYFIPSLICFSLSLLFRKIDSISFFYLPMGTHWLWHILSAAGSFFLSQYLYTLATMPGLKVKEPTFSEY
jgi:hypothetical protein